MKQIFTIHCAIAQKQFLKDLLKHLICPELFVKVLVNSTTVAHLTNALPFLISGANDAIQFHTINALLYK